MVVLTHSGLAAHAGAAPPSIGWHIRAAQFARWPLLVLVACLIPLSGWAADPSEPAATAAATAKDLFSEDLASLLDMKVTTASKFSQRLSDAPAVMSVVTEDELRRFGGMTLREILERVPGLAGSTGSFTDRSMVAARGDQSMTNGGHILFLINGRPTREILDGGIISDLLESFPVNVLERIEVMKGPGSVLYGSNAFSAVINLITRKAQGNELIVTGQGGPGGAAATSGQVMFRRGDLSIVGAGQFHQKPEWVTPVWSTGYGLQTAVIPDRGKGAYLGVDYKGLSIMSSFTEWNTSYLTGEVGGVRWRRGFADLGYHWNLNSAWEMSVNLTYTRATGEARQGTPIITGDSDETLVEWTNIVKITGKDRLTIGALYSNSRGTESFVDVVPSIVMAHGSRRGGAFYAQLEHELFRSVKLIGGVQVNKMGAIELDAVPRAGLVWTPTSHWGVKVLYSEAFRAPSLSETLLSYNPPSWFEATKPLGNLELRPERVATTDVGLSYQRDRFQAGVDYFHSRQTDSIAPNGGIYVNGPPPPNSGGPPAPARATFQGVELEGKSYLKNGFFVTGSMLYQANKDGRGRANITPMANFGAKAGISYESQNGFTAGLFSTYQGHIEGYSGALNPRPGAYGLLNGNLRLELSKFLHVDAVRGLALVAHAENLENRQLWLPNWNSIPGDSIFVNRGRTVYIGVEMSWKKE